MSPPETPPPVLSRSLGDLVQRNWSSIGGSFSAHDGTSLYPSLIFLALHFALIAVAVIIFVANEGRYSP